MSNKSSEANIMDCPFCGGSVDVIRMGNNYTKRRSITLKCNRCRVSLTNSGIRMTLEELVEVSTIQWNQRVNHK